MKQKKTEQFIGTAFPQQTPDGIGARVCRGVLGGIYLLGCLLALHPDWVAAGAALGVYGIAFCLFGSRFAKPGLILGLGTLTITAGIFQAPLQLGAAAWLNPLLDTLETVQGRIYLPFAVETGLLLFFMCWAGSLLAVTIAWGVQRQGWMLWLPLAVAAVGSRLGLWDAGVLLPMAAAQICLALTKQGRLWQRAGAMLFSAVLILAAVFPFAGSLGIAGERLGEAIDDCWSRWTNQSALPEGRLTHLGALELRAKPALQLTMEQPQKLYLRGFVGQRYTGRTWKALPAEQLEDCGDLFYFLHQADFYAQTQVGQATALANQGEAAALTVEMEHRGRWAYLPTGLLECAALDDRAFPDAGTRRQERAYRATYQTGGLAAWYSAQGILSTQAGHAYLAQESAYRDFVYETYLQLPDATVQALGLLVGEQPQALSLQQVQEKIRSLLAENLTYDASVVTDCATADFVAYTLMAQGRGYSVHYATAAACLLRYFGVPSRYVEGYFLPAAEAETIPAGQPYDLDESHVHAWAEFYLDGVGWIPFEVTPGYEDQEEQTLQGLLEDPDSALHQAVQQIGTPHAYQPPQAMVQQPQEESGTWLKQFHWLTLLWVLLLLACLAGLTLLLGRRLGLRRRFKALKAAPPKEAVAGLYAYSRTLLELANFPWDTPPFPWAQAAADHREALFSSHPMTQAQKNQMLDFAGQARQFCKHRWPWYKRLYFRWIRGIF